MDSAGVSFDGQIADSSAQLLSALTHLIHDYTGIGPVKLDVITLLWSFFNIFIYSEQQSIACPGVDGGVRTRAECNGNA